MAKKANRGSLLVIEELLERGDPLFLDELRAFSDADQLGSFAMRWYVQKGPPARDLLLRYLELPLNAYRHEPLVKRLFKLAEAAQDDAVMARFLAAFDRTIRRSRRRRYHFEQQSVGRREDAEALQRKWQADGAEFTHIYEDTWRRTFHVSGRWPIERIQIPRNTTLPRKLTDHGRPVDMTDLPERVRRKLQGCQLFSVHTRHYLRRRAWRYFRKLGKTQPERYVQAAVEALLLFRDSDVVDGLALLDNWGLVHILFHRSPALIAKNNGWRLAPDRKLGELTPMPIYEDLWTRAPRALLQLVRDAKSRTVRQWAIFFLRRGNVLASLSVEELLSLLSHQDADVALLASDALLHVSGLENLKFERWLEALEDANAVTLDTVCALLAKLWSADRVALEQAVRLACRRPVPIARLGMAWLEQKTPASEADCRLLLGLTQAESDRVRGDATRWMCQVLTRSPHFQPGWVLELLDSRHADVRAQGWQWMHSDARTADNVELWQRLLESPHDDVRLKLIAALEQRHRKAAKLTGPLDPKMIRLLWASVLLNIHRGNRAKPVAVSQMVRRLQRHSEDAALLLPILSVALRSIRGPEWRAGLSAVMQLLEREPGLEPLVRQTFPELKWT
jgi:hypothetical protein